MSWSDGLALVLWLGLPWRFRLKAHLQEARSQTCWRARERSCTWAWQLSVDSNSTWRDRRRTRAIGPNAIQQIQIARCKITKSATWSVKRSGDRFWVKEHWAKRWRHIPTQNRVGCRDTEIINCRRDTDRQSLVEGTRKRKIIVRSEMHAAALCRCCVMLDAWWSQCWLSTQRPLYTSSTDKGFVVGNT